MQQQFKFVLQSFELGVRHFAWKLEGMVASFIDQLYQTSSGTHAVTFVVEQQIPLSDSKVAIKACTCRLTRHQAITKLRNNLQGYSKLYASFQTIESVMFENYTTSSTLDNFLTIDPVFWFGCKLKVHHHFQGKFDQSLLDQKNAQRLPTTFVS